MQEAPDAFIRRDLIKKNSETIDALRRFVFAFANCPDISYRDEPGRLNLAIPVDVRGPKGSHYLLMAAAIDVGTNSNHIRPLLVRLHGLIPGGLFALHVSHAEVVLQAISEFQSEGQLPGWQVKREVPRILRT